MSTVDCFVMIWLHYSVSYNNVEYCRNVGHQHDVNYIYTNKRKHTIGLLCQSRYELEILVGVETRVVIGNCYLKSRDWNQKMLSVFFSYNLALKLNIYIMVEL